MIGKTFFFNLLKNVLFSVKYMRSHIYSFAILFNKVYVLIYIMLIII